MILSYSKWKQIFEAERESGRRSAPTLIRFQDPDSVEIFRLFNQEYLPSIIPNYFDRTVSDMITVLSGIQDETLKGVIDFFKAKGYQQPNEKIKRFQQELMNNTSYSKFINADNRSSQFDDGVFGVATARALIRIRIENLNMSGDKHRTIRQTQQDIAKVRSIAPDTTRVAAPRVSTENDLAIEVGTQSLK